jgi:hypothetical protein
MNNHSIVPVGECEIIIWTQMLRWAAAQLLRGPIPPQQLLRRAPRLLLRRVSENMLGGGGGTAEQLLRRAPVDVLRRASEDVFRWAADQILSRDRYLAGAGTPRLGRADRFAVRTSTANLAAQ